MLSTNCFYLSLEPLKLKQYSFIKNQLISLRINILFSKKMVCLKTTYHILRLHLHTSLTQKRQAKLPLSKSKSIFPNYKPKQKPDLGNLTLSNKSSMTEKSTSCGSLWFTKWSRFFLIQNSSGGRIESKKYNGAEVKLKILRESSYGQLFWKQLFPLVTKESTIKKANLKRTNGTFKQSQKMRMKKKKKILMKAKVMIKKMLLLKRFTLV